MSAESPLISRRSPAHAAGVTPETWRTYERIGRGRLTRPLLNFVRVFPDVSLDYLIDGNGRRPRRMRMVVFNPFVTPARSTAPVTLVQVAS